MPDITVNRRPLSTVAPFTVSYANNGTPAPTIKPARAEPILRKVESDCRSSGLGVIADAIDP